MSLISRKILKKKKTRWKNRQIKGVKFKWEDCTVVRVLAVFLSIDR